MSTRPPTCCVTGLPTDSLHCRIFAETVLESRNLRGSSAPRPRPPSLVWCPIISLSLKNKSSCPCPPGTRAKDRMSLGNRSRISPAIQADLRACPQGTQYSILISSFSMLLSLWLWASAMTLLPGVCAPSPEYRARRTLPMQRAHWPSDSVSPIRLRRMPNCHGYYS